MYVCMYVYMRCTLGRIAPRACGTGDKSAFLKSIFTGKRTQEKLTLEWIRTGTWCMRDQCFHH